MVIDEPNMGLAVIALSLMIRILLLPMSLSSRSTEEEKEMIGRKYAELNRVYKDSDPLRFKKEKDLLVKSQRTLIRSELVNLAIQILVALILFRIFAGGLEGSGDFDKLYSWTPKPDLPFNLEFMGIDLTKPSLILNVITSLLLFIVEILSVMFSPWEPTRNDRLMQFILPVGVFLYLYGMPSGKKLFVITTLIFSVVLMLVLEAYDTMRLASKK